MNSLISTDQKTRCYPDELYYLIMEYFDGVNLRQIASKLGISPEVAKTTIYRWRKRFREIVKIHIASTVSSVSEVDEELGYLIHALAANQPLCTVS